MLFMKILREIVIVFAFLAAVNMWFEGYPTAGFITATFTLFMIGMFYMQAVRLGKGKE